MNNEMERRKKNGEDKKNLVKIIYRKQFFSIYSTWAIFLHLVILNFYVPGMNARSECAHDIYVYRRMYSTQHIHYYSAKCFAFFCPFVLAAQRSCWYNWIAEWKDRKIEQFARKNENEMKMNNEKIILQLLANEWNERTSERVAEELPTQFE